MRFRTKAAVLGALSAAVAFVMLIVVGSRVAEQSDRKLKEAHLEFVLARVNDAVQANLSLDLPLGELQDLIQLFERTITEEADIEAVEVFTADGVSAFGTDRGAEGERVPGAWLAALRNNHGRRFWRVLDRDDLVLGTAVETDFGTVAGYTVIVVKANVVDETANVVVPAISQSVLPLIFVVIVGGIGGFYAADFHQRRTRRIARRLLDDDLQPQPGDEPLVVVTANAAGSIRHARGVIAGINRDLQAIDAEI